MAAQTVMAVSGRQYKQSAHRVGQRGTHLFSGSRRLSCLGWPWTCGIS